MSQNISTTYQYDNLSALIRRMSSTVLEYWYQAESYQKFVYVISALLFASGIFHIVVFLLSGEGWGGPVSWRKPVVFGLSFGVTTLSLAWVMSYLPRHKVVGWLLMGVLGLASLIEVSLITLQKWRGVPSHFNEATPLDAAVFNWMGFMVAFVMVVIVALFVWSLFSLKAPQSMAWAIRTGLLLLVVGQLFGVAIIANELTQATSIETASIFGAAGQIKVPHAVSLHAIQVLPILAWLFQFTTWSEDSRTKSVLAAAAGYIGLAS
jgi:hypothetical protein